MLNLHGMQGGMLALFEGLGPGAAPSLCNLSCGNNTFGPAGAQAISAAISRGAMPKLENLRLDESDIDNQDVAALAPALKKLLALKCLDLGNNRIGDEGVRAPRWRALCRAVAMVLVGVLIAICLLALCLLVLRSRRAIDEKRQSLDEKRDLKRDLQSAPRPSKSAPRPSKSPARHRPVAREPTSSFRTSTGQ